MRVKISTTITLLFTSLLVSALLISCSSDSSTEEVTLSGEVKEMVRYYQGMKQIGLTGDVEAFLARRDSVTKDEIRRYSDRKGMPIDSVRVSNWAFNWPDIAGLPLIQDTGNGEWRRLVFKQCGMFDKAGKEQCIFPVVLWHKDGDEWKVSNATKVAGYRYTEDGTEWTPGRFNFHKLFRIPPSFEDFYPRPDSVEPPKPQPIDPKDLPQGARPGQGG